VTGLRIFPLPLVTSALAAHPIRSPQVKTCRTT
jgi:pentapeptide MXKDX repeat protein